MTDYHEPRLITRNAAPGASARNRRNIRCDYQSVIALRAVSVNMFFTTSSSSSCG
jgi:hypothetical protein